MLQSFLAIGQSPDCTLEIKGYVIDEHDGHELEYAEIFIEELKRGTVTSDSGFFAIKNICAGGYHVIVRHIGCAPERRFIQLDESSFFYFKLHHHSEQLAEILVHGTRDDSYTQQSSSISQDQIRFNAGKDLASLLSKINGVTSLSTGTTINKPVIHGLSGNRVGIVQNGVVLSGQQWGNDHAPEIDPMMSDHIKLIKGAASVRYINGSLGSIIELETDDINDDPHVHGNGMIGTQDNGRGILAHATIEQSTPWISYRLKAGARKTGDASTPDYLLRNTGTRLYTGQLFMQRSWKNTDVDFSLNTYNAELGILRGSVIGNTTDLALAFSRDEPFFTRDTFSSDIVAPRQQVNHHTGVIKIDHSLDSTQRLSFKYSAQLNKRKEFDNRRGGRTNIPALSLNQWTQTSELFYQKFTSADDFYNAGLQFQYILNDNVPGTGIDPLLPDYNQLQAGVFLTSVLDRNDYSIEWGLRYDYKNLEALTITRDLPRRVERVRNIFHAGQLQFGARYNASTDIELRLDLGFIRRAPEVHELHSFGLHQGVSSIEEGNSDLQPEHSFKSVLSIDWTASDHIFISLSPYYQRITDFIFLNPQNRPLLTIRGAFPYFIYEQTDAVIAGVDIQSQYRWSRKATTVLQYSYLYGQNTRDKIPLIFMPSNTLNINQEFTTIHEKWRIALSGNYVFKQNRLLDNQDFVPAPEGYFLLGASIRSKIALAANADMQLTLRIENILNTTYRNYLNRQRYYADELGRSISLNASISF